MSKKISLFILAICLLGLYVPTTFANTSTLLTISKTTTLTDQDASKFANVFGSNFPGNYLLTFECKKGQCQIVSTKAGFSGKLARELLKGRSHATFVSNDKNFILDCGKTSIAYCNVIQKDALLP